MRRPWGSRRTKKKDKSTEKSGRKAGREWCRRKTKLGAEGFRERDKELSDGRKKKGRGLRGKSGEWGKDGAPYLKREDKRTGENGDKGVRRQKKKNPARSMNTRKPYR